jgi:hypothetical protein
MARRRCLTTALLLALAAGCAARPAAVALYGDTADISAMAGEWRGMYEGPESGRAGSICRLATAFEGTIRASISEGAFTMRNLDSGATQTGRWRVVRQEVPQRPHH